MRVHAFTDDALADHDAVAIAERIREGEVSAAEVAEAAVARSERVEESLRGVVYGDDRRAVSTAPADGPLAGVPTFVKDNTDVRGMPTNHGTSAFVARPSRQHGPFTRQYLSTGMTVLGKSRLPEFGFNATTEFQDAEPTRNPWHTGYSSGASSGGAAALVAAGVVPIAHANDGGGSIRIPAACCGLVGLKPSKGRHIDGEQARSLPINIISEGVVTRSVRDTAAFWDAAERYWRNPELPPIGRVEGPARRRLRIGLVFDSVGGVSACPQTRATVENTAAALEKLGHDVEPVPLPIDAGFIEDFTTYWGLLSFLARTFGKRALGRDFDARKLDGLSVGLYRRYRRAMLRTPAMLYRLSRIKQRCARMFTHHEVVLSPVLAHVTPELGYLSPTVPFETLLARLQSYVAYTPLNNVAGTPAISLPTGEADNGLPIGVQLSAAYGDERTLLEVAYELEGHTPWRRIQD
ncbi:amidase [Haloechinothrix sp. LS1_15]|uniref:amidase n=1 Tax=Haloechinothrix sp. LS1_15 TaxID=2652248 RepID=UPI002945DB79|nr:amidase [Haloechinothrix sp. LS1_15]MDV6014276.1 amidase [Haloechinothrix sp. LS1_15]